MKRMSSRRGVWWKRGGRLAVIALGCLLLAACTQSGFESSSTPEPGATAATSQKAASPSTSASRHWVAAWQGSPTASGSNDSPSDPCPSEVGLSNQTIRNTVFISAGGDRVRARLTNAFGTKPVRVGSASIAVSADGGELAEGSSRPLRFGGRPSVRIPSGGEVLSDPVSLRVKPLQTLAISIYVPTATGPATSHLNSFVDNYLANGDHASDPSASAFSRVVCWMFADGVDVETSDRTRGTVVALGDSITDGAGSSEGENLRYPDQLARRLSDGADPTLAVVNAGISGNRLLGAAGDPQSGVSALARLERDVLTQTGVKVVILCEGINDIGAEGRSASDLISADKQIIAAAHAQHLLVLGGTLTPFLGADFGRQYGSPQGEKQRQALNAWIRSSGAFDGVIDFDQAVRDPADPTRLLSADDSGDHLHPSDAGYAAMAAAISIPRLLQGS